MSEDLDIDHPDAPDSVPDEVVEFVRDADMLTLGDLDAYLDRELTVRASAILETDANELPSKYLRDC
ncbi:hypothetical protein OB920_13165 [Halobacteria archaeon HArc-gm2]|nr:hypothetical protein [Halobacteria archaeon HArc-gm2]